MSERDDLTEQAFHAPVIAPRHAPQEPAVEGDGS